jgi:hypothetical protein
MRRASGALAQSPAFGAELRDRLRQARHVGRVAVDVRQWRPRLQRWRQEQQEDLARQSQEKLGMLFCSLYFCESFFLLNFSYQYTVSIFTIIFSSFKWRSKRSIYIVQLNLDYMAVHAISF